MLEFRAQMKNFKRILIALFISFLGIVISHLFLKPNNRTNMSGTEFIAMAKVISITNDVKRQGRTNIIWEPVRKGDILYLGDKIKTSSLSSSQIEFLENKTVVDIEPESLLAITKNDKQLKLKVIEGSLFVSSIKNESEIALSTESPSNKEVTLQNGKYSFSVNKDGQTKFEVIKSNEESTMLNELQILTPEYGDSIYIESKNNPIASFKYQPSKEALNVKFEIGNRRDNLKELNDVLINTNTGLIEFSPTPGTYFWRLSAEDKNDKNKKYVSNTYKVTFNEKLPPITLYPSANELIQIKDEKSDVEFRWSLSHPYESLTIEIKGLNNNLYLKENIKNLNSFVTNKINVPGKYIWKVIGKINNDKNFTNSSDNIFEIAYGKTLQSPTLFTPEENSIFYTPSFSDDFFSNLKLTWRSISDADEYILRITNASGVSKETKTANPYFTIPKLPIGNYQWTVLAVNNKKEFSKNPLTRNFIIQKPKTIEFKTLESNYYFTNELPSINIQWSIQQEVESYRLKVASSQSMSQSEIFNTKNNYFNYQTINKGQFFLQVEALDLNGNIIALSELKKIIITKPPLPPIPIFLVKDNSLESNLSGDVTIELKNYDEKLATIYDLYDLRGISIDKITTRTSRVSLKSLKPGEYFVTARFQDEFSQLSEPSLKLKIKVPEKSAITAPKIKGIKIR